MVSDDNSYFIVSGDGEKMRKIFQIPSAQTIIQHFMLDPQSVGQDAVAWPDLTSEEVGKRARCRQLCVQLKCERLNTKSRRK